MIYDIINVFKNLPSNHLNHTLITLTIIVFLLIIRHKVIKNNFHCNFEISSKEKCEICISFNEKEHSSLMSFCNTIETPDGGSHENALKNSLTKAIKLFGQKNQIKKYSNSSVATII